MLGLLQDIVEVIEFIPDYFLYALETVANLFFAAIEAIWVAATSLIPLPAIPAAPEYISTINWFFPIGSVISIMTPIVTAYVAFLLVRWAYKWACQL